MTQIEIERKFLVKNNSWKNLVSIDHPSSAITQLYLINSPEMTIRLGRKMRRKNRLWESEAAINIKMPRMGVSRNETEMLIDPDLALSIMTTLRQSHRTIEKVRSFVETDDNLLWEIDEFVNTELDGLVIAEIEVPAEDYVINFPDWIGQEVTNDRTYYNAVIAEQLQTIGPIK